MSKEYLLKVIETNLKEKELNQFQIFQILEAYREKNKFNNIENAIIEAIVDLNGNFQAINPVKLEELSQDLICFFHSLTQDIISYYIENNSCVTRNFNFLEGINSINMEMLKKDIAYQQISNEFPKHRIVADNLYQIKCYYLFHIFSMKIDIDEKTSKLFDAKVKQLLYEKNIKEEALNNKIFLKTCLNTIFDFIIHYILDNITKKIREITDDLKLNYFEYISDIPYNDKLCNNSIMFSSLKINPIEKDKIYLDIEELYGLSKEQEDSYDFIKIIQDLKCEFIIKNNFNDKSKKITSKEFIEMFLYIGHTNIIKYQYKEEKLYNLIQMETIIEYNKFILLPYIENNEMNDDDLKDKKYLLDIIYLILKNINDDCLNIFKHTLISFSIYVLKGIIGNNMEYMEDSDYLILNEIKRHLNKEDIKKIIRSITFFNVNYFKFDNSDEELERFNNHMFKNQKNFMKVLFAVFPKKMNPILKKMFKSRGTI